MVEKHGLQTPRCEAKGPYPFRLVILLIHLPRKYNGYLLSVDISFIYILYIKSLHKIRENFSFDETVCSWFISAFFSQ